MKIEKQQIFQLVCAGVLLIGALLMLVNTFTIGNEWAFWVGLVMAVGVGIAYIVKMSYSVKNRNKNEHEKNVQEPKNTKV